MNEITLSDEQLEKLAEKIMEKILDHTKQIEDDKIKKAVERAQAERIGHPFKLS